MTNKRWYPNNISKTVFWAIVVIIASTFPVIFGRSSWTFGIQALLAVIAFTQLMKK